MSTHAPIVVRFGDAALLVRFAERIDPEVNALAHAVTSAVRAAPAEEPWGPPIPGYASVLVPYDALRWTAAEAESALSRLVDGVDRAGRDAATAGTATADSPIEIRVRYGGADGVDLPEVADRTGLAAASVVELHSSVTYRAYMLGFAPGFAYLGKLPDRLRLPRRETPRPRVPGGSVAIAGSQTAVYPQETPGGWHLIGRTDASVWDALRARPALIEPGSLVRFVAVSS